MNKEKFYQKTWFTVLFLIVFFPIGLFTMWKYKKFNKIARIIISAFFIIFLIFFFIPTDNSDDVKTTEKTTNQAKESTTQTKKTAETTTTQAKKTTAIKPNTSQMVDDIAHRAKKSAKKGPFKEKRDEAVNYIVKHYPKYFTYNKTMEKTMYYGYYLEYAYAADGYDNVYVNLGMDTYQAVKGVYRNVDKVTDDIVVANLRQIKKGLNKLGYKVNSKWIR